jgi:GlcNAc-PI de-N-acetylase
VRRLLATEWARYQLVRGKLTAMATVVAFHAHPDDEAILTGGTLARLAGEGHRVVIVLACSGAMWPEHGTGRLEQFRRSAALLGAARAEHLGYYDSGHGPVLFPDPPDGVRFVRRTTRLLGLAVALPVPVFGLFSGREWFVEPGARPGPVVGDVLLLRDSP